MGHLCDSSVVRHLASPAVRSNVPLPSHPNVGSIVFTRDDWSVFQVGDSRQVSVPLASWSLFFGSCGSATARIGSASDVVGGSMVNLPSWVAADIRPIRDQKRRWDC